jgi:hypothetical protein
MGGPSCRYERCTTVRVPPKWFGITAPDVVVNVPHCVRL